MTSTEELMFVNISAFSIKSLRFSNKLKTAVLPLLKSSDVVLQPVIACRNKIWARHFEYAVKLCEKNIGRQVYACFYLNNGMSQADVTQSQPTNWIRYGHWPTQIRMFSTHLSYKNQKLSNYRSITCSLSPAINAFIK